jgi:signal peptidase I
LREGAPLIIKIDASSSYAGQPSHWALDAFLKLFLKAMFKEIVTDLLKDGYKVSFNAPGHSMYPTILANEPVVVEPVEPLTVHKGDIILYRSNGSLIAHRVLGVVRDDKADEFSSLIEAFSPDDPSDRDNVSIKWKKGNTYQDSNRCCSSEKRFFILRGDASRTFDEPVKSDQILGKVISIERNGNSLNPYSLQHKLSTWLFKTSLRLKFFLGFRKTAQ